MAGIKLYGGRALGIAVGIMALVLVMAGGVGAATLTVNISGGADYTRIQDAIDNASAGDTILVYSGTYYENVNVNKQLNLSGIDTGSGKPVVDAGGNGSSITLSAGNSTLEGFTIINSGYPNAGISATSSNNIIRNNTALNNYYGIYLTSSSNNMLSGNNASNQWFGISLQYASNNNTLSGNNASNNTQIGIGLIHSSNNTLRGNNASNNVGGIILDHSSDNTLSGNNASNQWFGISLQYASNNNTLSGNNASNNTQIGIGLDHSSNNTLSDNKASNNGGGIDLYSSSSNTLSENNASNNSVGIYLVYSNSSTLSWNNASNNSEGIYLSDSINNTLSGNNGSNNSYGIFLMSSSDNNLTGNTASSNNYSGIYIWSSNNNNLTANIVSSNNFVGISLSGNNTIYNNYLDNAYNFGYTGPISAIWNTTKTLGTNIAGGSYLGGNVWANPSGTGFSQTCADANGDGICDSPYMLDSNNTDYLPLAYSSIIGGSVISISSQTVTPVSTVAVPIMANNITNVAAYTISLTYNPAVVVVDSVGAGALGTPFTTINNVTGVTQMSAFTITPQSGNVILANVTLRAIGTAGQTSPLNLTVTALSDNNGSSIPATVSNGTLSIASSILVINASRANLAEAIGPTNNITTGLNTSVIFTVTDGTNPVGGATVAVTQGGSVLGVNTTNLAGQATIIVKAANNATVTAIASKTGFLNGTKILTARGDVNGDGRVDIIDALFIAQYTVGTRTINTTVGDVSGDGNANIVDALFIAQYTVGLRPDPTTP